MPHTFSHYFTITAENDERQDLFECDVGVVVVVEFLSAAAVKNSSHITAFDCPSYQYETIGSVNADMDAIW